LIKQTSYLNNPLITIVIPAYNRLPLLRQAIASVVAQTYIHWELIIVDDGSEDGTADAIISMNDVRIRVLKMEHLGNIALLRNAGVKAGAGSWLAFLDSDDVWTKQKLEIQLKSLTQAEKRWSYGGFELMNNEMHSIAIKAGIFRPISGWITKELLTTEASVNIGTLLVERTLFEEVGGFDNSAELLYREDYELVIRLSLKSEALAIPDLLMRVREHEGRITKAFEYGNDRTAAVYQHFINTHPEKSFAKIARRRMASEIADSAIKRIKQKKYLQGTRRLGKALIQGDSLRHIFSVIWHSFY
jgi:glycosyltransferase involved in cell wall biosynthesis